MKRLPAIALGVLLAAALGVFFAVRSSNEGTAQTSETLSETPAADAGQEPVVTAAAKPETNPEQPDDAAASGNAEDDPADVAQQSDTAESDNDETKETDMSDETATAVNDEDAAKFKTRMHEGDVALGVCGARVSALLWFYEASVAQGRDDLAPAVESLTETRKIIKAEAERRATEDKVDTSVRVMNDHSEKLWNELNEKADGDAKEFQTAHDGLVADVQECLNIFFDRPEGETSKFGDGESKAEDEKKSDEGAN